MNIEQSWSRATCAQCGNKVPTEVPRLAGWIEELRARVDALTKERNLIEKRRDVWIAQCFASQSREKALREALQKIEGLTYKEECEVVIRMMLTDELEKEQSK